MYITCLLLAEFMYKWCYTVIDETACGSFTSRRAQSLFYIQIFTSFDGNEQFFWWVMWSAGFTFDPKLKSSQPQAVRITFETPYRHKNVFLRLQLSAGANLTATFDSVFGLPSQVGPSYGFDVLAMHQFISSTPDKWTECSLYAPNKDGAVSPARRPWWRTPEHRSALIMNNFKDFMHFPFPVSKEKTCVRGSYPQITRPLQISQNRGFTFNTYSNSIFLPLFGWHSWETIPVCSWSLHNAGAFVSAEQAYQPR